MRPSLVRSLAAPVSLSTHVHVPLCCFPRPATPRDTRPLVPLLSTVFNTPYRPDILHTCVTHHLTVKRQGTASTKTRSELNYSGKKRRPQKGTGKARMGDTTPGHRRGGAKAFGPRPRDWSTHGINRKVTEFGLRVALSQRWRSGELSVILTPPELEKISTKILESKLAPYTTQHFLDSSLFLLSDIPKNFECSARNLPGVRVTKESDISVYELLKGKRVILDQAAVQLLENRLAGASLEDPLTLLESEPLEEEEVVEEEHEFELEAEDQALIDNITKDMERAKLS